VTGARPAAWWPAIAWAALVLAVSSLPRSAVGGLPPVWGVDKLAHAAEYLVLALLVVRALGRDPRARRWRAAAAVAVAFAAVAAYGALDELHQLGIPGRHASAVDFCADAAGAAVGAAVGVRIRKVRPGGRCA
jgi:VanZ family protein